LIVISYQARPSDKFYISWSRHPRALACASITHDASPDRLDRVARCLDARSSRLAPCHLASLAPCHLASMPWWCAPLARTLPRCLAIEWAPCLAPMRSSEHRASLA